MWPVYAETVEPLKMPKYFHVSKALCIVYTMFAIGLSLALLSFEIASIGSRSIDWFSFGTFLAAILLNIIRIIMFINESLAGVAVFAVLSGLTAYLAVGSSLWPLILVTIFECLIQMYYVIKINQKKLLCSQIANV